MEQLIIDEYINVTVSQLSAEKKVYPCNRKIIAIKMSHTVQCLHEIPTHVI